MSIKCAIVDDEFLAREYLSDYISKIPFLELVGTYNSPLKIIDTIKNKEIELLFLDIQMPDITGIDFLKSIEYRPNVIITTAFKEFALEGFELNVVDYLLKPFSFDRFLKAVDKVVAIREEKEPGVSAETPVQKETTMYDDYIIIRADRKLYKINYDDLLFVEGQKAYVTFHTKHKKVTAIASLRELEEKLPSKKFVRIHKSYIVSIKDIDSLEGNMLEIKGNHLPVGKSFKEGVEKIFGM